MALHSRYKSAPQLGELDDLSLVVLDTNTLSDGEGVDFTENERDFLEMEVDERPEDANEKSASSATERSKDADEKSASSATERSKVQTLDVNSYMSESEVSPFLSRKKRRAPLPPTTSPYLAARNQFISNDLQLRTSTDTESSTDSRFVQQTSTDSESFVLTESALGSNFPGELAGVDNLRVLSSSHRPHSGDASLLSSPRGPSKLDKLFTRVFHSPQVTRRKTMKENSGTMTAPRVRKTKKLDGDLFKTKKSKLEDGTKSGKSRTALNCEPLPEMSNWILIGGSTELVGDHEFEVKRIPDYEDYLAELITESDPSQLDYVDISRCLDRVRSMMKERDETIKPDSKELADDVRDSFILSNDTSVNADNTAITTIDNTTNSTTIDKSNNITTIENTINSSTIDSSTNSTISTSTTIDKTTNSTISTISKSSNNEESEKQKSKSKGLSLRRKSAPSAMLFKTLPVSKSKSPARSTQGRKDTDFISLFKLAEVDASRMFIMEGAVQFADGMQVQDRYLFLFSDLLLVAKQKSSTSFKLKNKVHLCDMWIASCAEEVSEVTIPSDRSFVLGWPITNVVAVFPTTELKDDWLNNLRTCITKEKLPDENQALELQVSLKDIQSTPSRLCHVTINNYTQVKDVVMDCLRQVNVAEDDAKDYQLWGGLSAKDGSPYPLIGHETPFSIKRSQARELSRSKSGNDLDSMNYEGHDPVVEDTSSPGQRCEFYLQQKKPPRKNFDDASLQKQMKKNKKSNFLNKLFKKRNNQHFVFGLPLADICDAKFDPPEAILNLMVLVYKQGPQTLGILRRSNNVALGKEILEKIDSGEKYALEDSMVLTAASVFKEFLRLLPGGLLMRSFHDQWLSIKKDDPYEEKMTKIKTILSKLPPVNYSMIKLTICLLQHLAKQCSINSMSPSNLATCIAPSLYAHEATEPLPGKLKEDLQKQMKESLYEIQNIIAPLVAFMITNHIEIFGEDILGMFVKYGCTASPAQALVEGGFDDQMQQSADEMDDDIVDEGRFSGQGSKRQLKLEMDAADQHGLRETNSGTDSDSMHSVLSMHDVRMGLHRDDSSIDSLGGEREYGSSHESPKAVKSHLSPSNLSRDSGLTLSDNQLYDEDTAAYHADIASTSMKMFYARPPHYADNDTMDTDNNSTCSNNTDYPVEETETPVPPPRKRSVRKRMLNMAGGDGRQLGVGDLFSPRAPLTHSASTTNLDDSHILNEHKDHRSLRVHSSLDKRVSSDSIGEELEMPDSQSRSTDFHRMSKKSDMGTLIKSRSGGNLIFDGGLPTGMCMGSSGIATDQFLRQSSVSGSSVPVSPESRRSQSSCDSVISDSTYSFSRDGSVHSAPLTPDEPPDKHLDWVPDIDLPGKPWQGLITPDSSAQKLQTYSKSTPDISARNDDVYDHISASEIPQVYLPPNIRPENANEADETTPRSQDSHMSGPSNFDYSGNDFLRLSQTPQAISIPGRKPQRLTDVGSGSPPPNVILKTLPTTSRRDVVPVGAGYRDFRSHPEESREPINSDPPFNMHYIRQDDYIHTTAKPVIISPDSSQSSSSTKSRAKLSKYINPTKDVPQDSSAMLSKSKELSYTLPNYQQVVKRTVINKNDIPDEEYVNQRETNIRAQNVFEPPLKQYNEKTQSRLSGFQPVMARSNQNQADNYQLDYALKPKPEMDYTFQQEFGSDNPDDSGASGFLDMGSISKSLHQHVASTHADSNASSAKRSISPENCVSLSRNGSKLSDSSFSSGSSITISTLGKRSDSFGRSSILSNTSSVTVSSVTSSDGSIGAGLDYGVPTHSTSYEEQEKHVRDSDDYNEYEKTPEEIYLRSLQLYEQQASIKIVEPNNQTKQQVNTPQAKRTESRATLNLEVQNLNLHRSCSDSSEHAHKVGTYTSRSPQAVRNVVQDSSDVSAQVSEAVTSPPRGIQSELHDNFLKARSCFHQQEMPKRQSSTRHASPKARPVQRSPSDLDARARNWPRQASLSTHTSPTVAAYTPAPAATHTSTALPPVTRPDTPSNRSTTSSQENKNEFPWSVKDLKSKYDNTDNKSGDVSHKPTSQPRPHAPPPYLNPPPFRNYDSPRQSPRSPHSSSSSDNDQLPGPHRSSSHRQGPQNYLNISPHDVYTSFFRDDSSPDGQSSWLSSSSLEDEQLSDYTNTTYI